MQGLENIFSKLAARYPELGVRLREANAVRLWESTIGPGIAAHAKALKVENKRLWIEVDHPAWKSEILFRKRPILDRLNETLKAHGVQIEDLFLIDPKRSPSTEAARTRAVWSRRSRPT